MKSPSEFILFTRSVPRNKKCSSCNEILSIDLFHNRKDSPDGKVSKCKRCVNVYSMAWAKKNPEKMRLAQKRFYSKEESKEKRARYMAEYKKKNPTYMARMRARRRLLEKNSGPGYSEEEWNSLLNKFGHQCVCCGRVKPLEADHIVPLSKGGTHSIDNIQPLCRQCNMKKHVKIIDYRKYYAKP